MATSLFGTCRTRRWSGSSRAIQTGRPASISPPMGPNCGPAASTTPCARGTFAKADNCSSMILPRRYFLSVIVQPGSGWPLEWRTRTWKYSTPPSLTNTNCICTTLACSRCVLPPAESGLSLPARTTCWMLGVRHTVLQSFRQAF